MTIVHTPAFSGRHHLDPHPLFHLTPARNYYDYQ